MTTMRRVCFLLFLPVAIHAELFTAMADMTMILHTERNVLSTIEQYIDMEMSRLSRLRGLAEDFQEKNDEAARGGEAFVSNPVNAYLLVKRLTSDWHYLESIMKESTAEHFIQNITVTRQMQRHYPGSEDLVGAAEALLRLQDTYNLPADDIVEGKIAGSISSAQKLNAHDCFELGRVAYNENDFYHTMIWMDESLRLLNRETTPSANEAEILEYFAYATYQQGNFKHALKLTERLRKVDPDHPRVKSNLEYYQNLIDMKPPGVASKQLLNHRKDDGTVPKRKVYEALCRGDMIKEFSKYADYYCYYKTDHPFLRLAPFKAEIAHRLPLILIFRNVISDAEIEVIKHTAQPSLARATVQDAKTGENIPASYRISKSAWLSEFDEGEDTAIVQTVNLRSALITGLEEETAEDLQVANYGLGGHYDPHLDFAKTEELNAFKGLSTGNRIATLLYYMSAPEAGGATVFTELHIALKPTKHDAAFWFNLKANGEGDLRTRHAACPVLSGVKWVANKWFHEYGNEDKRPCSLDRSFYE